MEKFTQRRFLIVIALIALIAFLNGIWSFNRIAEAQEPNLLTNGGLERPYYGQGSSTRTVPNGWSIWLGSGAPDAFPHPDKVQVRDGEVSWNVKQGYTVFTAAGYQRVSGFQKGDGVRATAYGWVYTCDDTVTSCVIQDPPYRRSDTAAGASLKVGVDPTGGTDPNSASVVWSPATAPYDQWAEMSVTAVAEGDSVTVFLYMTQTSGLALNNVYWDQASLVRTTDIPEVAEPTPAYVPFVVPQGVQPDGGIVHIVQAGDTLSSIAYAYSDYGVTKESIAELNGVKPNHRYLFVGQELIVLPPGSVDPVTGQLLPAGAAVQPLPPQPEETQAEQNPPESPVESLEGDEAPITEPDSPSAPVEPAEPTVTQQNVPLVPPPTYATMRVAFFPFERGYMLWLEDTNQIYVLISEDSAREGTFTTYLDTWQEGMPATDETILPPPGFSQPEQGFGLAWRTYPGVRDSLGWGTGGTVRYTGLVIRDNGRVLVNGPDNRVYDLAVDGGWNSVDFYAP
jgi:LysM repeat protein